MSNPSLQQDVSVLSSAKNGLSYLTANDWTLLADKAARMKFKAGDYLTQQGRRTRGIFLLLSGSASVHIPDREILPALGPGEVCGEISFLDEQPATVSVIAKQTVEAYYLDAPTLHSLFELFPHLGSRFYRSLALSLSGRVRNLIGAPLQVPK
ncbi:MAG: cyclic nucleotide-binding domain-containing protein [Candidatus Sulfotelmatobacter sp.]